MISDLGGFSSKATVRAELKERARVFIRVPALKMAAEEAIVSRVQNLLSSLSSLPAVVAGFNALSDEVDLSSFYHSTSCGLVFPKLMVRGDSEEMQFTRVENYRAEKWDVSALGFKHPTSIEVVPADQIQVMLVPGLGFSARGERLGRGKGFYDRYLNNYKGLKVGICFDCQWSEVNLPTDSWDIKMDYIITETKCFRV